MFFMLPAARLFSRKKEIDTTTVIEIKLSAPVPVGSRWWCTFQNQELD